MVFGHDGSLIGREAPLDGVVVWTLLFSHPIRVFVVLRN